MAAIGEKQETLAVHPIGFIAPQGHARLERGSMKIARAGIAAEPPIPIGSGPDRRSSALDHVRMLNPAAEANVEKGNRGRAAIDAMPMLGAAAARNRHRRTDVQAVDDRSASSVLT